MKYTNHLVPDCWKVLKKSGKSNMKKCNIQITYFQSLQKFFACFAQTFANFAVNKSSTSFIIFLISLSIDLIIPIEGFSQEEKLSEIIISVAEELASDDTEPGIAALFIERLSELSEDPVRINSADEQELSRLFFLTDFQIKAIVDYINSTGNIVSLYELVNIPGFDQESVKTIIPFITLDNLTSVDSDSYRLKNIVTANLTFRTGNKDINHLGSPCKILLKHKFTTGAFSGGFTSEKDAGEPLLSGNPPQPDFLSGHLTYTGKGFIRKIIVGDFGACFGQGTNLNTGISSGISLTSSGFMSGRDEFRPYTSTDENNFFRGTAAEFRLKNLVCSFFFSKNKLDATPGLSDGSSYDHIKNLYLTGLHNTTSSLQKKDILIETGYGLNLLYTLNNNRLGFLWSHTGFSLPIRNDSNKPEDLYDFRGDRNDLITINYAGLIRKVLLYGELTYDNDHDRGLVTGISIRPDARLNINFLYRNYSPGFTSFHGRGPGTGSSNRNEEVILGNFTFELAKYLFISAGVEIQEFPWLKYRSGAPSSGKKAEIRLRYLPAEKISIEVVYYFRETMLNSSDNYGVSKLENLVSRSIKGVVKYNIIDNLTLITRVDYKSVYPSGNKGMLLLQDINYRFKSIPVSCWLRFCTFDTDDWDSRLYTYENDLLYSFSIPALSGKGSRAYMMAAWRPGGKTEFRIKYGITCREEMPFILKQSEEFKFQFRLRF